MSLPTHCIECNTRLTSKNRSSSQSNLSNVVSDCDDVCTKCYDYWGWENTHSDDNHEGLPDLHPERVVCPVCNGDHPTKRTGHANTRAHSRTSHATCKHERTPKGRAACRKARAAK